MSDSGVRAGSTRRAVLSASAATVLGAAVAGSAATPAAASGGPGRPVGGQRPDKELRALLALIDRRRIEATIQGLVSFGTRHTLSAQSPAAAPAPFTG